MRGHFRSQGVYGGATISRLTGTVDGDLDVVLEKLRRHPAAQGRAAGARKHATP